MSSLQTLAAQPEQSTQPRSDDTTLVWREIKYYETMLQHRIDGLYADFRETFDGWTKERFQKVHPEALRALKWSLRRGGVYTGNIRKQTAEALADLAQLPCVEGGVWPRPPHWDQAEFMAMRFNPKSEAHETQTYFKQQALQHQAARHRILPAQQPAGALTQAPAVRRPVPAQLPAQQASSAPTQGPPNQGPPMQAQNVRAPTSAPTQAPPVRGPPIQALTAQQPAQVPPQQPFRAPIQAPPARGPPLQAMCSQPFPSAGSSQLRPPQGQHQPGHQLQQYQSQPNYRAAQPPPPYSRHPPQLNNNQHSQPTSQASNPFSQPAGQRPGMNSSGQWPTIRQGSGQGAVQNGRGNGDGNEDESESDEDEDMDDDDDGDE